MIRTAITSLAGYTPGEQPDPNAPTIKLNTNENPYPPSPKVLEALHHITNDILKVYPPADAAMVRHSAANVLHVSPDEVLVGNGSDDILTIVHRLTLDPGTYSLAMSPTYTLYRVLAKLQGATLQEIPFSKNYTINPNFITDDAVLKLLPNPNAPTGTIIDKNSIKELCSCSKGIVLVDEAYVDFAPDGTSCVDLINEFTNLIVCRTLSKSYSLAGLRLGLAIANTKLIAQMHKVRDSYNVDYISQYMGAAALDDSAWMRANAQKIIASRTFLYRELAQRQWEVIPSYTNFLFAKPPAPLQAEEVYHGLKKQHVLVRHFNDDDIKDYIRISIGSDTQCQSLLQALDSL